MANIENLFKNKIQFFRNGLTLSFYSPYNNNTNLTTKYVSKLIDNNKDIKTHKDIMDSVEPFFDYIASYYKNMAPWIEYNVRFATSILKDDNAMLIPNRGCMIVAEDGHLRVANRNRAVNKGAKVETPFKISIYIHAHYVQPRPISPPPAPRIQITPPRPLPPLNNSFKTETCVICLTNKPNILLYDCKHTCICISCNSQGQILDCPTCRKTIVEKILI